MRADGNHATDASLSGRRLVVHVGMSKAGSTAIQNYLEQCRNTLAVEGVLFPRSGFARANPFDSERTSGHLALVRSIHAGDVEEFQNEVSASSAATVVLSAENLLLDRPAAELESLGRFFGGWDVTIVAVLRAQRRWLESRYIESVLSGFKCSSGTARDFSADAAALSWLDYTSALNRVQALLAADRVNLVNYDVATEQGCLVEAFLQTADIPVTDVVLARSVRANVREKGLLPVEAKRRLNTVLQNWPRDSRLAFEVAFRHCARRSLMHRSREMAQELRNWLALPDSVCRRIAASNAELQRKFGLEDGLECPVPEAGDRYQHRVSCEGMDELVHEGWLLATAFASQAKPLRNDSAFCGSSVLELDNAASVVQLLASSLVSLHFGSLDTALVAASYGSRLPILLATEDTPVEAVRKALLAEKLPSEIIFLEAEHRRDGALSIQNLMPRGCAAGVVIARGNAALDLVAATYGDHMPCPVVLIGCDMAKVAEFILNYALDTVSSEGDCVLLTPFAQKGEQAPK